MLNCWEKLNANDDPVTNDGSDTITTMPVPKGSGAAALVHSQNSWVCLMICRWEVDTVIVVDSQLLPAGGALLLSLDGELDALLAEDVATDGR